MKQVSKLGNNGTTDRRKFVVCCVNIWIADLSLTVYEKVKEVKFKIKLKNVIILLIISNLGTVLFKKSL